MADTKVTDAPRILYNSATPKYSNADILDLLRQIRLDLIRESQLRTSNLLADQTRLRELLNQNADTQCVANLKIPQNLEQLAELESTLRAAFGLPPPNEAVSPPPTEGPTVPHVTVDKTQAATATPALQVAKYLQANREYYEALQPLYALENQLNTQFEKSLQGVVQAGSARTNALRQFQFALHQQIFNGAPAPDPKTFLNRVLTSLPLSARPTANLAHAEESLTQIILEEPNQKALKPLEPDPETPGLSHLQTKRDLVTGQIAPQIAATLTDRFRQNRRILQDPTTQNLIQELKLSLLPPPIRAAIVDHRPETISQSIAPQLKISSTSPVTVDALTEIFNPTLNAQIKTLEQAIQNPTSDTRLIEDTLISLTKPTNTHLHQEITRTLIMEGRSFDDASATAAQLENTINLAAATTSRNPINSPQFINQVATSAHVRLTTHEAIALQATPIASIIDAHMETATPLSIMDTADREALLQNTQLINTYRQYLTLNGTPNAHLLTSEEVYLHTFNHNYAPGSDLNNLPSSPRHSAGQLMRLVLEHPQFLPEHIQTYLQTFQAANPQIINFTEFFQQVSANPQLLEGTNSISLPQPTDLFSTLHNLINLPESQLSQFFGGPVSGAEGASLVPQGLWGTLKGWGSQILGGAGKGMQALWGGIKGFAAPLLKGAISLGGKALAWLGSTVIPAISAFIAGVGSIALPVLLIPLVCIGIILIIYFFQFLAPSPTDMARSDITVVGGIESGNGALYTGPTTPFDITGKICWPVTGFLAMDAYTPEYHPSIDTTHASAIDIDGPLGDTIITPFDGTIAFAGWNDGYGNYVAISVTLPISGSTRSCQLRFGHMAAINTNIQVGLAVTAGTPLGARGSTGNSSGPHLHYEVHCDDGGGKPDIRSLFPPQDHNITNGGTITSQCQDANGNPSNP